jgi:acyl carrier protein
MTEPAGTVTRRSKEQVHSLVRSIVLELMPVPGAEVSDESRLVDDLGFHSLALLELAFALEDEFDLAPIDEATARRIISVRDIQAHILQELSAAGRLVDAPA